MHPDVNYLVEVIGSLERRIDKQLDLIEDLPEALTPVLTQAFTEAIQRVRDEPASKEALLATLKKFRDDPETHRIVGDALQNHWVRTFWQWLGGKVAAILGTAILVAVLVWFARTNGGKTP
jgi:hypothetical protein